MPYNLKNVPSVTRYPNIIIRNGILNATNSIRLNNLVNPQSELFKRSDLEHRLTFFHNSDVRKLQFSSEGKDPDKKDLKKKANLGHIIDEIKVLVPNILTKSLPKSIISNDITLRICPTHMDELNAYLPVLKGYVSYYTTCKTLQVILTSIVLSPKVKLHIQSIRTSDGADIQCVHPKATKIYVRWTTCEEGCTHLSSESEGDGNDISSYHSTSDAKLGSHRWSKFDSAKVLSNASNDGTISNSIGTTLTLLTTGLIGLTRESKKLERMISGIFIFELNDNNDKIIVHTIENVDIIERPETEDVDGELRIC